MSKPTKKQIDQSNASSFAQLLAELKRKYPFLEDFYYCDHVGAWCANYKVPDGVNDTEFKTFSKALKYFKSQKQ
ncbi:hypothetical protein [uncultured Spirosoma sp.]|uniref:hypothetical protein n=1 Tax=uncultured Spirosoma sp. TaxID=278208 RepID=UPI002626EB2B|nr:hypothetical protein [uncultured Spirosoma sp.]